MTHTDAIRKIEEENLHQVQKYANIESIWNTERVIFI